MTVGGGRGTPSLRDALRYPHPAPIANTATAAAIHASLALVGRASQKFPADSPAALTPEAGRDSATENVVGSDAEISRENG